MIFMDFENNPEILIAFKGRFFGINLCRNQPHYVIMLGWMDLEIRALEKKSKIFDPLLKTMLKLFFNHDKYEKIITVRRVKFENDWTSLDTFKAVMERIIDHLETKEKRYYENVKDNKEKKMKKKYGKNEQDRGDEESSSDDESSDNHNKKVCINYLLIFFVSEKIHK